VTRPVTTLPEGPGPWQGDQKSSKADLDFLKELRGDDRPPDLDRVLAHFTLAADVTMLRAQCRFAYCEGAMMARYLGLPFPALAFLGGSPEQLGGLAVQLTAPGESFYLLVNERQATRAERAFVVEHVEPEWQMSFAGDVAGLDPGTAVPLEHEDVDHIRDLAEDVGLEALEADPFRHGPAFGVWQADQLVSLACTRLRVCGAAEIGNVGTRTAHRRRGYARQAVSALTRAYTTKGHEVFLMVFQSNHAAVQLYEGLGFARRRPMFLMRCRVRAGIPGGSRWT